MPTTRSATQKKFRAPSVASEIQTRADSEDIAEPETTSLFTALEDHLNKAQLELRNIKHQIKSLQKEKHDLKTEIEEAKNLSDRQIHGSTSNRRTRKSDDGKNPQQVDNSDLRKRIKELTLENERQKKRIQKFMREELQNEVEDLLPKNSNNLGDKTETDPEYRMKKLLRKFSDLMLVTTIQDDMTQTCPICTEELQLNQCSALECQHLICDVCLPRISKGADETVKCAECRAVSQREALEKIHMTEQQRWDRLLEVAQAWDAWDRRAGEETSEEEVEESFIDDERAISEASANNDINGAQPTSSDAHSPCGDGNDNDNPPTPPPFNNRSFSESPMKEKRKRMEELAQSRAQKRKR